MIRIRLNVPQNNAGLNASSLKIACLALLFTAATAITSQAQTLTTLVDFDGTNGEFPYYGSLVLGSNGNYYGTTLAGGANGFGSVFEITPAGTLTTVYSFCSQTDCNDGFNPYGGLVLGADGNLYGTTSSGGANFEGTVFEITSTDAFSVLYTFCSQTNCTDGGYPYTGLTYYDGTLYGTTYLGGANGGGTIFSIKTGTFNVLYNFCSQTKCSDGFAVINPLVRATNGKFYGAAAAGGANGWGAIFEVSAKGKFSILHSFAYTDGASPFGGLVEASDKNLYGTTADGGNTGDGTVFKISLSGKLTTLYNFCAISYCPDGIAPYGTLIQGSDGEIYGTTAGGGTGHNGTVFEITTAGALTTLYSFSGTDGEIPDAGVLQGPNGDLYGTTYQGGDLSCTGVQPFGCGTVFSLTP
jgi:uncharacterized repeat protein (TIGR03803 family)